jgi:undecaprenyl-diphosphatase
MPMIIEAIKAFFIGIIQGITEWLPVSSTGHMILFNEFVKMDVSPEFFELFEVVIQFGSILAVLVLFFDKLNPFSRKKDEAMKAKTWTLWIRVIIAVLPAAIIGLLLDDWFQAKFYNYVSVAVALIFYGILFIVIERRNKNKTMIYNDVYDIDGATALKIGIFQVLSIIPGTSRSGSTILGASVIGVSRPAAAEFSFFLAIPVMLGASAYKVLKYIVKVGVALTSTEIMVLIVGTVTAFAVSIIVIRFLMNFVRKHSFESFGWYRIVLGIIVLGYNFVKIVVS